MRCRDFSAILKGYADVLNVAGAETAGKQIRSFAAAFEAQPTLTVSNFVTRVAELHQTDSANKPSLGDVAPLLSALKGFFATTAKAAVLSDLNAVEALSRARGSIAISALVQTTQDLVAQYIERLEAALGNEETFPDIYNQLRANPAMGKAEIAALTKQMTGSASRSVDAGLKKIWNLHQSQVIFAAKSRATGGRSAA